ncbi:hypothetical protein [Sporosarcina sp. FA9]|uniref:hypothetical protein n=1 Tax=Sporosarcina sp. FA9 TaxID=3413030 RepID=UPI003F657686
METNKITMMEAYRIEALRSKGISNDEIIVQLDSKEVDFGDRVEPDMDFSGLISLYEQSPQTFKEILEDGYTVKFITMNGLQNLLKMKFDIIKDRDYELVEHGVSQLSIDMTTYTALKQMLGKNCRIEELSKENDKQLINVLFV